MRTKQTDSTGTPTYWSLFRMYRGRPHAGKPTSHRRPTNPQSCSQQCHVNINFDRFNQAYISTYISTSRSKTAKWRTQRGKVFETRGETKGEDDRWMFKASGGRGRTLRRAVKDRRRVKWINKSRNGGRSTRQKTTAGEADWERAKSRSETEREPESLWRATREPREVCAACQYKC